MLVQEIPVSSNSSLRPKAQKVFQQPTRKRFMFFAGLMFLLSKGSWPAEGSGKHSNSCKTSGGNN